MRTPQLDHSETFTELYREEKREEGDNSGQEDKRRESKGKRQIQPVISSLSVLHCLEHTEIQSWVEKREGVGRRQRQPGGEKGESKGEKSSQASNLALK